VARITDSLDVEGLVLADIVAHPAVRDLGKRVDVLRGGGGKERDPSSVIYLPAEAEMLDPSIYPAGTRKAKGLSRFRLSTVLLRPRTVFLTGCTGWLGAHILEKLLTTTTDVTAVCLVRAKDEMRGFQRLVDTLRAHKLLDGIMAALGQGLGADATTEEFKSEDLRSRMVVVCGDLSQPMLGLSADTFRQVATEIDSILHCGAAVNLVKPYSALKRPNVMGTQEVLRLAVTNGLVKTKIKPVFYVSTNGVFPVSESAYDAQKGECKDPVIICKEDTDLAGLHEHLDEGYGMTKWVAEKMCSIAEVRGLPVHVMRPGNMAGSSVTGAQNQSDFVFLFVSALLALGAAPTTDMGSTYAFDLTPVDFAASAALFSILNPHKSIGLRIHLQNPRAPLSLNDIVAGLRKVGHTIEDVSRELWLKKMHDYAAEERSKDSQSTSIMQRVEAGFESFEGYFRASNWLSYGSDRLVALLEGSGISCPEVDAKLLAKWFPCASKN
jgi:thioester reductase-like protein